MESEHCRSKILLQVYFDVSQGDVDLGRIEIGLFGQIVPKTVRNFVEVGCSRIVCVYVQMCA